MSAARAGTEADAVLGVVPRTVLEPTSIDEAVRAMQGAARDKMKVAFVGGGTDLGLGSPPSALDAVLRTGRLSRVVEHAPADQIVVAEAGLTLGALQRALAGAGQRLALDPPRPEEATLGGIVAANAFGPLRTRFGAARDLIIGISFVRADGVLARGGGKVVKNVAGFDLPRLLVGSLGTLGLIATVTFRLHPLPEARATVRLVGLDGARVWTFVRAARAAQLEPAAVAALKAERDELGFLFEGFAPGVAQQIERLCAIASQDGLSAEALEPAAAAAFWERHDRVRAAGALRLKLAAPVASLPGLMADAIAPLCAALPGAAAAVYPTLGIGFVTSEPGAPEPTRVALSRAREATAGLGGSLVVCAAPAAMLGGIDPWGAPPESLALMRSLKDRLDPEHRLAPGRFIGGL
jgi:glycolate oxidase FAD binding subunit